MRAPAALALLVAAAAGARAGGGEPARDDPAGIEAWVGTWRGTATSKGCTAGVGDAVAVAVTWQAGAMWIDGAALYEGLGPLAADVRDGALVVDVDGLRVELGAVAARKGRARAALALDTAARCTVRATLTRDGVGIPACDGLLALADAADRCDVAIDDHPRGDADGWRALGPKARPRAGEACRARAAALRDRLVAADCIPSSADAGTLVECRDVWRQAERLARCERLKPELQQATLESVAALRRSLRTVRVDADGEAFARAQCAEAAEMLADRARWFGCP